MFLLSFIVLKSGCVYDTYVLHWITTVVVQHRRIRSTLEQSYSVLLVAVNE